MSTATERVTETADDLGKLGETQIDAAVADHPTPQSGRLGRLGTRIARRLGHDAPGASSLARAGQNVDIVGAAITLVVVAVVSYVGLQAISSTEDATSLDSGSTLSNASDSLDTGVESAFGLMEVVFIVLLLSVIIALLIGLRMRG
jgi:hypothetical protein